MTGVTGVTGQASAAALVGAAVLVRDHDEHRIVTVLRVDGDEPLFDGHYPEFPIFPGVALVEFAHHSALAAAQLRRRALRLEAVEKARFLHPVFPGDVLVGQVQIEETDSSWRCTADINTGRQRVATVRLRYSAEVGP